MVLADSAHAGRRAPYLRRFVQEAPRDRYAGDIARVRATIERLERNGR